MSYQSEVLADSPLLYLQFNETSGATCANTGSLAGNATALSGYTRNVAAAHANLGVAITSVNGITYPDTAALDITGNVTYELWLKTSTFGSYAAIMAKGSTAAPAGYHLWMGPSRSIEVHYSALLLATATNVYPNDSAWHHVAFTRSSNTYTIYLDGTQVVTGSNAAAISATNEPMAVGARYASGSPSNQMTGSFDEAAVYSTALSGARITAHYAAYNAAAAPAFVPQIMIVS